MVYIKLCEMLTRDNMTLSTTEREDTIILNTVNLSFQLCMTDIRPNNLHKAMLLNTIQ